VLQEKNRSYQIGKPSVRRPGAISSGCLKLPAEPDRSCGCALSPKADHRHHSTKVQSGLAVKILASNGHIIFGNGSACNNVELIKPGFFPMVLRCQLSQRPHWGGSPHYCTTKTPKGTV
jgi:hypothetical protein